MSAVNAPLFQRWLSILIVMCAVATAAVAGDLRITVPKHSSPTPVQKLNQEGVKAIEKHDYKKAKSLFYKAYLIDPDDPFTLNNLGYVAELEGQVDRAQRYYALSQQQSSDAAVYKSTNQASIGKPVSEVAGNAADRQMQINRLNVEAIGLLQKDRAPEADVVLQKALKLDANNPFTLNNLGYAREKEGELEDAYRYYSDAAKENSTTPIVVTMHKAWRGKGISEIAGKNAQNVRKLMEHEQDVPSQVARLNTRGVSAINRNDYKLARQYFQQAYKLDPENAFALNNMGYLSELDGDRESADFYYAKAKEAEQSSMRVAYATRKDAEGMKMAAVATDSDEAVVKATDEAEAERRREGGPVVLRNRDNSPVVEPATPPKIEPSEPITSHEEPAPSSNGGLLQPLPDNEQPGAQPNEPNNSQPAQPPANQPQGKEDNGLLMPLPDDQQPGTQPAQPNNAPQNQAQPPQANQQQQPQGKMDNGLMMPLPDNQQPPQTRQPAQPNTTPQSPQ